MTRREQIRPSNYKVNWISLASQRQFTRTNFNLFHYAGNNPVKYVDPDGRKVKNKSSQYILVRTEDAGYVVVPPKSVYDGENLIREDGEKIPGQLDKGKVDGVILSDGSILKVTDNSKSPFNVDITVKEDKNGKVIAKYGNLKSLILSKLGDLYKKIFTSREDYSGKDRVGSGKGAGNWLAEAPSQEKMKDLSKEQQTFINHEDAKKLGANND